MNYWAQIKNRLGAARKRIEDFNSPYYKFITNVIIKILVCAISKCEINSFLLSIVAIVQLNFPLQTWIKFHTDGIPSECNSQWIHLLDPICNARNGLSRRHGVKEQEGNEGMQHGVLFFGWKCVLS